MVIAKIVNLPVKCAGVGANGWLADSAAGEFGGCLVGWVRALVHGPVGAEVVWTGGSRAAMRYPFLTFSRARSRKSSGRSSLGAAVDFPH